MSAHQELFLAALRDLVVASCERQKALQQAATLIRSFADYRWVGLYDVDHAAGLVRNVVWSGPGALNIILSRSARGLPVQPLRRSASSKLETFNLIRVI